MFQTRFVGNPADRFSRDKAHIMIYPRLAGQGFEFSKLKCDQIIQKIPKPNANLQTKVKISAKFQNDW